ncbi:Pyruvate kinase family protein [Raphanus sativus]|uniref:pyruvate kinase n=1 Tax=Raphanus sativus TaxID=3726 RepID=A0A6J0LND0_RAPSA|nr:pyruvate kinase, cytosolic isozyme [Raphanus sativus]KAJ4905398.1 Pyruvate kinase family protein [Raphanus sativus]
MECMIDEQTIKKGAAKTKMVWTLGPASSSVEMIEKLLEAGMNIARFDFSEGSHAQHQETLTNLRTAIRNTGILCAVMLDLKGPEMIRTGEGETVNLPILTQKDKDDIFQWGIPNKINIIALSSVRKGSDLDLVREFLRRYAKNIMLLSKIDNEEAAGNVDEIMEKTDAVLLARGSPGVEQQKMIEKAHALGKPIVTAIQILGCQDDLTNAVLDCTTDCVMLLGDEEEAHPDIVLDRISSLCKELESSIDYKAVQQKIRKALPRPLLPMARKAAIASWKYTKAKAIITTSKGAAKLVAKCRPSVPVLLVVSRSMFSEYSSSHVASYGLVSRGVIPLVGAGYKSIGDMVSFGVQVAKKEGICSAGDSVVALRILDGFPAVYSLLVQ